MITQLDILAKNVIGNVFKSVNIVGVGGVSLDEVNFEALYNEEANFLANQEGGFCSNYQRLDGNRG